jgi:Ser-tRNA(Ala) deacylase AlaX
MYDLDQLPVAYVRQLDVVVTEVRRPWVALDRSPFAPATPERPSDTGTIGRVVVDDVVLGCDGTRLHRIGGARASPALVPGIQPRSEPGLEPGCSYVALVDWERRFALMRLHSALHLVYLGFEATHGPALRHGRRVTTEEAWVDLEPSRDLRDGMNVAAITTWVNRVISDDLLIARLCQPGEPSRPYWYVDGVGSLACSGLHPQTTGEIGAVEVGASCVPRGMVRLTALLSSR